MRALAEWVMRGRAQAIAAAIVATAIPLLFWLSAAVVALVTLRRGWQEGVVVVMWAMLPAAVSAWFGDVMPMALLIGALVLGAWLRATAAWPWTLCGATLLGLLLSAGLTLFAGEYLAGLEKMFADLVASMTAQAPAGAEPIRPPRASDIAGMFGLTVSVMLVLSLLVARWCQAMLYNPGGFRTEFHALRLSPAQVLGLMAIALGIAALGAGYRWWAWMPLVPMLFAGLGLAHAFMATSSQGALVGWLFYLALILLPPVKQMVVMLAAVDGWLDLRRRLMKPPGT